MQINIKLKGDQVQVSSVPEEEGEKSTLSDIMTGILVAFTGIVENYMRQHPPEDEDIADTYDAVVYLFNTCLNKLFPDVKALAFELSDAAVLYGMDKIVDEAAAKGITFDEAIAEYEKKAQEYVTARKMS